MSKTVYGYIRTGNYLGVTNIGDGVPLMKGVSNNDYDIKSIDGSNGVTVTDNSDKVTIGIDSASSGFLIASNNLSDVPSKSTARTNLGLGSSATQSSGTFLQVANNLSDVSSASTSRTNLGLGSAATQSSGTFLQVANNLSDISDKPTACEDLLSNGTVFTNFLDIPSSIRLIAYNPGGTHILKSNENLNTLIETYITNNPPDIGIAYNGYLASATSAFTDGLEVPISTWTTQALLRGTVNGAGAWHPTTEGTYCVVINIRVVDNPTTTTGYMFVRLKSTTDTAGTVQLIEYQRCVPVIGGGDFSTCYTSYYSIPIEYVNDNFQLFVTVEWHFTEDSYRKLNTNTFWEIVKVSL